MESLLEPGNLIGAIFSASPDAVVVINASGVIVLSSPAVEHLFGYFPEELIGETIELLVPNDLRHRHSGHIRAFFASPHARQMGAGLELLGLHRNGETFAVDVSLTPVMVRDEPYVAAFVRDSRERQRGIDRLHAVNEITKRLLRGVPVDEVLPYVAERARKLAGGVASWVVTPASSGQLVIIAADGPGTKTLIGTELSEETSRSAQVLMTGHYELVEDFSVAANVPDGASALGLGPGMYVPLIAEGRPICTLVVARSAGDRQFESLDIALAEVFAGATAVALELAGTRQELGRLELIEEDERIARDLHDTVIQQIFAVGMSLQAARHSAVGPLGDRIDAAVTDLDNVIRDIRNTIFRLPGRTAEVRGLRDKMFQVAARHTAELGFTPRVDFHGPVDAAVSDEVAEQLLHVLSEALSNVARHAKASSVEAVVEVKGRLLSLSVADDGIGMTVSTFAGHGLRNMLTRAEDLGGTFGATNRQPSGTVIQWNVPLK
jgi:PAS domain S-box-containing protein